MLQYDPDQERLACQRTLVHKQEIWDVATTCQSQDLLLTVWGQGGLWLQQLLTLLLRLAAHSATAHRHAPRRHCTPAATECGVSLWRMDADGTALHSLADLQGSEPEAIKRHVRRWGTGSARTSTLHHHPPRHPLPCTPRPRCRCPPRAGPCGTPCTTTGW